MSQIRKNIISKIVQRDAKKADEQPRSNMRSIFGSLVFSDKIMNERLPRYAYKEFKKQIEEYKPLDVKIADVVASAMRDWAVENGATHYTHWFQPLTGRTAEKHDAFVSVTQNNDLIMGFSGKELIRGEPDASSLPSGGIRETCEARGYTVWDPTSPAFIKKTQHGATLFIPTAFYSYTGEALDLKTPLIRSQEVLSNKAVRLLKLLGDKNVKKVTVTAGCEQEYFLIDSNFYAHRPDMVATGRTLFGRSPFKGQEMEDHYFGAISSRVLNFMMDYEVELYKLGVPIKTRHNEVAPSQYEVAPFFEDVNLAVDHNLLTMDVMSGMAGKHGFRALLHEKPFDGINGSGKHCNWSMSDNDGNNLLDLGSTPYDNMKFMVFFTAVVRAVDKYARLLRVATAHIGNDHRLGGFEAPPTVISVFVGSELEGVINNIISGKNNSIADGGSLGDKELKTPITLGTEVLPKLPKDTADRNRTSPVAFTGNKFEFRTLGSSQNTSALTYLVNAVVTESIDYIGDELEEKINGGMELKAAVQETLKIILSEHKRIIYNHDGYSDEWLEESAERGLPNLPSTIDAIKEFDRVEHVELLEKYGILNKSEIESRKKVRIIKYIKTLEIEMRACLDIASTIIIPAVRKHALNLALTIEKTSNLLGEDPDSLEMKELKNIASLLKSLIVARNSLEKTKEAMPQQEDTYDKASFMYKNVVPGMADVRKYADELEGLVDDDIWPLPKYREMLATQ